jgi:hypothetical protein
MRENKQKKKKKKKRGQISRFVLFLFVSQGNSMKFYNQRKNICFASVSLLSVCKTFLSGVTRLGSCLSLSLWTGRSSKHTRFKIQN